MDPGYVKGSSDNLPRVDFDMVVEILRDPKYISAEVKHVKMARSSKESYGDNAVGYVQLRRENDICFIKGKITPEHKIKTKMYTVYVEINEKDSVVMKCECLDCAASTGGCKHGVAFLFWLHRRSEEPSVTSTTCYWKKSILSTVKDKKYSTLEDLVDEEIPLLENPSQNILSKIDSSSLQGELFNFYKNQPFDKLAMHNLAIQFSKLEKEANPDLFVSFLMNTISPELCTTAEETTRLQSKTSNWYNLRYGRITASHLYEAAKCKTADGALVETILGAVKPFRTYATERGLQLEEAVLKQVAAEKNIEIHRCGLFLRKDLPIFGASPDGISEELCIEIKCPSKEKNFGNYIQNGIIGRKYYFQMQLQMLMSNKKKALFCVAAPDYEISKKITIKEVDLDEEKCKEIMNLASDFWKTCVYPKLTAY